MNKFNSPYVSCAETESVGRYTAKTFGWMFLGLFVTFLVAITTAVGIVTNPMIRSFVYGPLFYVLAIAEVMTVIFLSARIEKMSVGTARVTFLAYAILNGVVFSTYFIVFSMFTLVFVFAATALIFGVMAVIGMVTKTDFSRIRPLMTAGLIGLLVFWILGMFINLSQFEMIACTIGIFLFLVFTIYDTKKIREYHAYFSGNEEMLAKASVFGALSLYLDFINLFIYLLRFIGIRGRD